MSGCHRNLLPHPTRPLPAAAATAAVSKVHCCCLATSHTVFPSNRTTGGVCQSWTSVHLQPPHPPLAFSTTFILSSFSLSVTCRLSVPHSLSFKWLSVQHPHLSSALSSKFHLSLISLLISSCLCLVCPIPLPSSALKPTSAKPELTHRTCTGSIIEHYPLKKNSAPYFREERSSIFYTGEQCVVCHSTWKISAA